MEEGGKEERDGTLKTTSPQIPNQAKPVLVMERQRMTDHQHGICLDGRLGGGDGRRGVGC